MRSESSKPQKGAGCRGLFRGEYAMQCHREGGKVPHHWQYVRFRRSFAEGKIPKGEQDECPPACQ